MRTFGEIIRRYGDTATLEDGSVTACLIQPVLQRSSEKVWEDEIPLGEIDLSRYYGFFPPEAKLDGCGRLTSGDKSYVVLRAEMFSAAGTDSHWEAMLRVDWEAEDE